MPFGSEQWMYSTGFYPHEIDQSLRFNDDDFAYLSRTPASAGNRKTWTWSGWVKRGTLGGTVCLLAGSDGVASSDAFYLNADTVSYFTSGLGVMRSSTAVYRDPSAWYHIVGVSDSSNATAQNRFRIYVNGIEVTTWATNATITQNRNGFINSNTLQVLGANVGPAQYFDGYMAEVNFIDGQALDATSFGEFKSGVWIPKSYSGTYGTNGFYLDFAGNIVETNETDDATVTAPFGGNGEFAKDVDGLAVISNTSTGGAFTLVQYDLGAPKAIRNYKVYDLYFTGGSSTFQLQYSTDGSSWGTAASFAVTQNVQDFVADINASGSPITARYWRLAATAFGTNGSARVDALQLFSGQISEDVSGNSNDWNSFNLAATDQVLDSPTNNFCTWNPLEKTDISGYSEGNTEILGTSGSWSTARATVGISSGKRYWEISNSTATYVITGLANASMTVDGATYPGDDVHSVGYFSGNGTKYYANTSTSYGAAYGVGDVIGVALDADAGSLTFYKNGVSQGVAYTGLTSVPYFPVIGVYQGTAVANFGQDSSFAGNKTAQGNTDANGIGDFYYAPPAGYLALCTANLPDPAIDPAQDDVPADYFNTVLYQGDGTSPRSVTGIGFQPDFVWMKSRTDVLVHGLYDAVRGPGKLLISNLTNAEIANDPYGYISSYDTDGFTLTAGTISNDTFNRSTDAYVSWNWLAGNGTTSNTDGTIASTVSANQKAGFSIVTYTGNGIAGATVGHGLNQPIDLYFMKNRSASTSWPAIGKALNDASTLSTAYMLLNSTLTATSAAQGYGDSSTIELYSDATNNSSGDDFVAYCFHSVEGYSKIGSYTGNGSTDGPFVYTGFRPAFVMIKKATGTTADWFIGDSDRSEYNPVGVRLMPNLSDAEAATSIMPDMLSNGFKLRSGAYHVNSDTVTYIYMAFAEMPFKYSNAR